MKVTIRVDDRAASAALDRLRRAGADLTPAMREIAATLEDAAERSFGAEAAPSGTPWEPLSATTIDRRSQAGTWPGRILQVTGGRGLAGSMSSRYDATSAVAGTNKRYAATLHFGAKRGEFGSDRFGRPIPWGDIPSRPFLGIGPPEREEITTSLNRHFRPSQLKR